MKSSNNQEFLKNLIKYVDVLVNTFNDNNLVAIKDMDLNYVYVSESFAKDIFGSNPDIIIEKSDLDLQFPQLEAFCKASHDEDSRVLSTPDQVTFLKIYAFSSGLKPVIFNKAPLINKDTGESVGLAIRAFHLKAMNLTQKIIHAFHIRLGVPKHKIKLTPPPRLSPREQQVTFLFLANFASADIANIINQIEGKNISKSYIDKVFAEQLYVKFNVNDRKSLYDKMVAYGFSDSPPPKLLSNCSIEITNLMNNT